jgi:hypothetical protein
MKEMTMCDYDNVQRPPAIQNMLNTLSKHITGQEVQPNTCSTCGKVMDILHLRREFTDELSLREWHISHMCMACQKEVFEGEDDSDYYFADDPDYQGEPDGGDMEDQARRGFGLGYD